jgi:hypothetical protein
MITESAKLVEDVFEKVAVVVVVLVFTTMVLGIGEVVSSTSISVTPVKLSSLLVVVPAVTVVVTAALHKCTVAHVKTTNVLRFMVVR